MKQNIPVLIGVTVAVEKRIIFSKGTAANGHRFRYSLEVSGTLCGSLRERAIRANPGKPGGAKLRVYRRSDQEKRSERS
jgi:hypothetical protein